MKIGVVGGGISGLLSALSLEKEGHDVFLFEKDKIGGLCRSEKIDGYTMDIGIHAITMLNNGPLIRLLKKYSKFIPNFRPYGDYYVRTDKLYKIPVSLNEWTTTPIIPNKDKILIITRIMDLMTYGFDKNTSVYDAIKDMDLSETSIKFFNTISYFLSGEDAKKTPLWRLFTGANYIPEDDILPFIYADSKINPLKTVVFKKINRSKIISLLNRGFLESIRIGSKKYINKFVNRDRYWTQGYPVGGIQSICDSVLFSLDKTKIINEEVVKIVMEEGQYIIETNNSNSYTVDVVVYSAPSRTIPNIVKNVEEIKNKANIFKNIKHSKSLTVWIGHEDNPLNYTGSEIWIDTPVWATCVSNYDKNLSPSGKHLLGFSFINISKKMALNIIEEKLNLNLDRADLIHFQECIPEQASCVIGQNFVYPKLRDDFYIVGTDADPRSMGITRAAYSVEVMLSEFKNTFKYR